MGKKGEFFLQNYTLEPVNPKLWGEIAPNSRVNFIEFFYLTQLSSYCRENNLYQIWRQGQKMLHLKRRKCYISYMKFLRYDKNVFWAAVLNQY